MQYFTMYDSDQFSFLRVPKELITNEKYRQMSAESKLLYGLLLDRVSLSRKNGWVDDQGRVFIIFTRAEISNILVCGEKKITKLFNELKEKKLVEEKRQGLQKPNLIYVGKFLEDISVIHNKSSNEYEISLTRQKDVSGPVKKTALDPSKRRAINTNINNTNISNTDLSINQSDYKKNGVTNKEKKISDQMDGLNEFENVALFFEDQFFSDIRSSPGVKLALIDEIKLNVLDMYFSEAITINGERKCQEIVRAVLMRLKPLHIDNVIYKFNNISGRITNSKAYIQTMLYNEALESNLFMLNQVATDMANWKD
ncbi:replication initiator protein A [Acetobacterium sp.]|uniref:replication initiator protein A n=1 Tax=Acetobacterium sp. TaxID=1872094 RepID=UPI002F3F3D39